MSKSNIEKTAKDIYEATIFPKKEPTFENQTKEIKNYMRKLAKELSASCSEWNKINIK